MAKYEILERSFIHQRLWEPGEIVTVDDDLVPGPHMKPLDAAARKAIKKNGIIVGCIVNYVDAITGFGVSPQDVKSGINASNEEALAHIPS